MPYQLTFLFIILIQITIIFSNANGPSSLTISSSTPSESSTLSFNLKHTNVSYSLGIINQDFLLQSQDTPLLTIKSDNDKTIITGKSILSNSLQLKGPLTYKKTAQWRMIAYDSFKANLTSLDWSYDKTMNCKGNLAMLGGYCHLSTDEIKKSYKELKEHSMVKIEAIYHAIGKWEQNTGYMKLKGNSKDEEEKYLWTMRCKSIEEKRNDDICGYPVCSIGNVINVTFKHSDNELRLAFGATLNKLPCDQSYGISDVKVYIR